MHQIRHCDKDHKFGGARACVRRERDDTYRAQHLVYSVSDLGSQSTARSAACTRAFYQIKQSAHGTHRPKKAKIKYLAQETKGGGGGAIQYNIQRMKKKEKEEGKESGKRV